MKNKKQIKQTIKTMKQVSCTKKENNNNKKIKTQQKRSPFVFFAFY